MTAALDAAIRAATHVLDNLCTPQPEPIFLTELAAETAHAAVKAALPAEPTDEMKTAMFRAMAEDDPVPMGMLTDREGGETAAVAYRALRKLILGEPVETVTERRKG